MQKKRPQDPSQLGKFVVDIATGEIVAQWPEANNEKDAAAAALGRKGGRARAEKLTKEQKREIAKKAAKARWTNS